MPSRTPLPLPPMPRTPGPVATLLVLVGVSCNASAPNEGPGVASSGQEPSTTRTPEASTADDGAERPGTSGDATTTGTDTGADTSADPTGQASTTSASTGTGTGTGNTDTAATDTTGSTDQPRSDLPDDPDDHRTKSSPAGQLKRGWTHLDLGTQANYDNPSDVDNPSVCPDPDAMHTRGTVDYDAGTWTITGSGEGFMHGWDQGSLVYLDEPISGDFTFQARIESLTMEGNARLDGAAQALLNVRENLGSKQPTHSILAGPAPGKFLHMARFRWDGEDKWWYWPAWPDTWPDHEPIPSWVKIEARGPKITAYSSSDGLAWHAIVDHDPNRDWYPFELPALAGPRYVGLVCSARNDRNYAPMTRLSGKSVDCRDPDSAELRARARCVFRDVSITTP